MQGHPTSPRPDREITDRKRLLVPVEDIVKELNGFLRGWAGYFRYGNSARVLGQIRNYALRRVALLLSKTGKRRRAWDWGMRQVLRWLWRLKLSAIPPDAVPYMTGQYIMNTDRLKKFLGPDYGQVIRYTIADAFADSFKKSI